MRSTRAASSVHPLLIVFPLALLVFAVICDALHLFTGDPRFAFAAFWNMGPGIIATLVVAVAAIAGAFASGASRSMRLGQGFTNLAVALLFGTSWWMRSGT